MEKTVKKLLFIITFLFSLAIFPPMIGAKPPDYNGGVLNEYTYEEYFFLSGEPVKFTGKATVTEKEAKNQITTTYRFNLQDSKGDKLSRSVVYVTDRQEREDKGQTTFQTSVRSYSEKVTVGKDNYSLDDFQFSQGTISDNRPASDYYSGNIVGRKIYKKNSNELITVHISGRNMGYKNFWGATETQFIDYEIESNQGKAFITSKVSDSKTKSLQYEPHDPSLSSFIGGHAVISRSNMIGEYTYNIPYSRSKEEGTVHLSQEMVPTIDRLIVPKFRDLANNWAKDDIERLYSLGVFDESTQFFSPNTPMLRYQFTVGVLKAVNIRVMEQQANKNAPRKAIFSDLDPKDRDYLYIESAVEKGIITGTTNATFKPNSPISRVQAVAILVRALGMEGRAPSPNYRTNFVDNDKIEDWAKDSVYVAAELGLIKGDNQNRFNPNQPLSRAQASALIIRFLDFLENDLKQNYRDDMLFFN
ncbi:S-layer homology domain-containing protein [Bacillus sp. FJAT-29790]|uniref:S-layer homology domain-containing protein n=1 Tax=Bacillus sp. FJAT-29790 TaxID=1895002 RepID=UPI001C230BFC|nr:S-layer homology domain-containing protein [Bacillus sp. FJAT-29790]MBU8881126.1 S-layer homology domain-containing protein [Bacillus sp. FJAT-29790]